MFVLKVSGIQNKVKVYKLREYNRKEKIKGKEMR